MTVRFCLVQDLRRLILPQGSHGPGFCKRWKICSLVSKCSTAQWLLIAPQSVSVVSTVQSAGPRYSGLVICWHPQLKRWRTVSLYTLCYCQTPHGWRTMVSSMLTVLFLWPFQYIVYCISVNGRGSSKVNISTGLSPVAGHWHLSLSGCLCAAHSQSRYSWYSWCFPAVQPSLVFHFWVGAALGKRSVVLSLNPCTGLRGKTLKTTES